MSKTEKNPGSKDDRLNEELFEKLEQMNQDFEELRKSITRLSLLTFSIQSVLELLCQKEKSR